MTRDIAADTTGTITITADFSIEVPEAFLNATSDIRKLAESYKNIYPIDRISVMDSVNYCVFRKSYTIQVRQADGTLIDTEYIKQFLKTRYYEFEYGLNSFQPMPFDGIIGTYYTDNQWHQTTTQPPNDPNDNGCFYWLMVGAVAAVIAALHEIFN